MSLALAAQAPRRESSSTKVAGVDDATAVAAEELLVHGSIARRQCVDADASGLQSRRPLDRYLATEAGHQ